MRLHLAWTAAEGPAGRGARLRGRIAAGAWLAAATLTKGPLALAFFAASALGLAVWERRLRDLARPEVILGGVVCLALSAIWPVWLVQRLGLDETLAALRAVDLTTREGGPLHYLLNLPLQLLPWTIFVPALALHLRGTLSGPSRAAVRFLVAGLLGVFVLLHLSETKHSRYLLPAFPPLCLLLGTLWFEPSPTGEPARLPPPRIARWRDGAVQAALWVFLVAGVAGLAALPFVPEGRVPIAIAAGLGTAGAARGCASCGAAASPAPPSSASGSSHCSGSQPMTARAPSASPNATRPRAPARPWRLRLRMLRPCSSASTRALPS
ncbi:MAG: hypothetical protein M0C28_18230 [Candidatus Moduliflexus flocculans]|nr:hypothetical protein [Candidatus Moduliflexus flocculans]